MVNALVGHGLLLLISLLEACLQTLVCSAFGLLKNPPFVSIRIHEHVRLWGRSLLLRRLLLWRRVKARHDIIQPCVDGGQFTSQLLLTLLCLPRTFVDFAETAWRDSRLGTLEPATIVACLNVVLVPFVIYLVVVFVVSLVCIRIVGRFLVVLCAGLFRIFRLDVFIDVVALKAFAHVFKFVVAVVVIEACVHRFPEDFILSSCDGCIDL